MSNSLKPHGLYSPWNSLGQNSGVGSLSLFQGNEMEIDVFLEFPCFLYDAADVGNLTSGILALSRSSLYIWKFLVHVLKPSLKDFEHYLVSMWNEHSCTVVWTFFCIVLIWNWNYIWPFPVLRPLLSFPNLLAYWLQHFNSCWSFNGLEPGGLESMMREWNT